MTTVFTFGGESASYSEGVGVRGGEGVPASGLSISAARPVPVVASSGSCRMEAASTGAPHVFVAVDWSDSMSMSLSPLPSWKRRRDSSSGQKLLGLALGWWELLPFERGVPWWVKTATSAPSLGYSWICRLASPV